MFHLELTKPGITDELINSCLQAEYGSRSPNYLKASLKLLANSLAVSTGVSLPPIVLTYAVPTMTPSASFAGLKPLAQHMEALRADERVAPRRHFHELRQGFSLPNHRNASRKLLANFLAASTGL